MYVSELWFWLKISKCCKSLKIKFLLVFPCRHTTSFQCRYYVERLCTTSYRRWNDDVFIRSLSSIKLHTIGLFHYHLKISENQKSFDAFKRYRKWLVAWFFFYQNSNISVRLHSFTSVLEARQLRRMLKSMQTAVKKMHGRITLTTLFLWRKCYLWTNLIICSSICLAGFKHVCVLCFGTTYLKAVIYFCEKAPPLILGRFLDIPLATLHGMK